MGQFTGTLLRAACLNRLPPLVRPTVTQSPFRLGLVGGFALAVVTTSAETPPPASAGKSRLPPEAKAAVIRALPKFTPKPAPPPGTEPFISRREPVDPDVLTLPKMTVQEKVPQKDELLTLKGKVDQYMDAYLGSKNGLDRGLLNKKSANWSKGGVSYSLFGAMTNEDRALEARFDDQRLRHREDLLATIHALEAAGDPEKAAWLRRQSSDLFIRKADLRRK